ncbi:MAG: transcriptional regulator, MarR family [Hyphomicrobiales bacterium]|nr:transcriptional regulator, MarR family [Hyphomicrobiales bacterium]
MSRVSAARAGHETPDYADAAGSDLRLLAMPGHHIRRLQQVAVRLFVETVGPELTPVQYAALVAIAQRPGAGQAALAALIGYDRATIGGVIDRLEQKGWVERKASPEDRRLNLLSVTAQGREALARATPAVQAVQEKLLEPLEVSERAQFERMCLKMLAAHLG